jgi:hypothetical protein
MMLMADTPKKEKRLNASFSSGFQQLSFCLWNKFDEAPPKGRALMDWRLCL